MKDERPSSVPSRTRPTRSLSYARPHQALRDAIEELREEHRQEIQRLSAAAHDEAVQFHAAIRVLREQLEEAAFQTQSAKQEAVAGAAGEIAGTQGDVPGPTS